MHLRRAVTAVAEYYHVHGRPEISEVHEYVLNIISFNEGARTGWQAGLTGLSTEAQTAGNHYNGHSGNTSRRNELH